MTTPPRTPRCDCGDSWCGYDKKPVAPATPEKWPVDEAGNDDRGEAAYGSADMVTVSRRTMERLVGFAMTYENKLFAHEPEIIEARAALDAIPDPEPPTDLEAFVDAFDENGEQRPPAGDTSPRTPDAWLNFGEYDDAVELAAFTTEAAAREAGERDGDDPVAVRYVPAPKPGEQIIDVEAFVRSYFGPQWENSPEARHLRAALKALPS